MTRREQILAQIATQLATIAGANVYRSRVEPLTRGESPAIIVEPRQDQAAQSTIPRIDWSLTVAVTVFVRANVPDQAADPLVQQVHAKMMQDLTLGGVAYDVQPQGVQFEMLEADVPAGIITSEYVVLYKTALTDLTTLG
jgi:hypothetical protein